jgi:hypothetical protein
LGLGQQKVKTTPSHLFGEPVMSNLGCHPAYGAVDDTALRCLGRED